MWDTHLSIVFHIRLHVSKTDNFAGSNSNLSTTFLFLSTISEVHPVKEVPVARWWTTYSDLKIHTHAHHTSTHTGTQKGRKINGLCMWQKDTARYFELIIQARNDIRDGSIHWKLAPADQRTLYQFFSLQLNC